MNARTILKILFICTIVFFILLIILYQETIVDMSNMYYASSNKLEISKDYTLKNNGSSGVDITTGSLTLKSKRPKIRHNISNTDSLMNSNQSISSIKEQRIEVTTTSVLLNLSKIESFYAENNTIYKSTTVISIIQYNKSTKPPMIITITTTSTPFSNLTTIHTANNSTTAVNAFQITNNSTNKQLLPSEATATSTSATESLLNSTNIDTTTATALGPNTNSTSEKLIYTTIIPTITTVLLNATNANIIQGNISLFYKSAVIHDINVTSEKTTTLTNVEGNKVDDRTISAYHSTIAPLVNFTNSESLLKTKVYSTDMALNSMEYINPISEERINKLFEVLYHKESVYSSYLNDHKVLSFNRVIGLLQENRTSVKFDGIYETFENDIRKYLKIHYHDNGNVDGVVVTEAFTNHLRNITQMFSTKETNITKYPANLNKNTSDFVIVSGIDSNYYETIQGAIQTVHTYFPDSNFVIFDLGLQDWMRYEIMKYCKCELKKFNFSAFPSHFAQLRMYAFKPCIVQHMLNEYSTVLWMDSSIRFQTNYLEPLMSIAKTTSLVGHIIMINQSCSTNPKMFDWFNQNSSEIGSINQMQAGINLYYKNFLNALIMKAWYTCALDQGCIAPDGVQAQHWCCGCHRYDQSALTMITTYFFEISNATQRQNVRAANAVYTRTAYYDIRRGEKTNYFAILANQSLAQNSLIKKI